MSLIDVFVCPKFDESEKIFISSSLCVCKKKNNYTKQTWTTF